MNFQDFFVKKIGLTILCVHQNQRSLRTGSSDEIPELLLLLYTRPLLQHRPRRSAYTIVQAVR